MRSSRVTIVVLSSAYIEQPFVTLGERPAEYASAVEGAPAYCSRCCSRTAPSRCLICGGASGLTAAPPALFPAAAPVDSGDRVAAM
ncbi:MAG TPA: hypothetical protein VK607_24600 [Kofleriaceae bacterium]|nr:hypothetical protein [Kofleriaceae bacterium]